MRISDWSSDVCSSDLGVALTPAGEVLLKHAHAVFRQLECLNADLQPYSSGIKGRLRLLANTTATNSFLADAMSTFLAENPDVDIELEEKISGDIVLAIRAGAADLGIVAGNIDVDRSEEHTSELQSLMRISSAVFCLKKKNNNTIT